MKSFDLVFISTFTTSKHVGKLVNSIANFNQELNIFHIVVNQSSETYSYPETNFYQVNEIETFKIISLSDARNIGIDFLLKSNIQANHIMFPDDDAFFKKDFFEKFESEVSLENNYLIDVRASDRPGFMKEVKRKNGEKMENSDFFSVSSINMIVSFNSFKSVGYFNPLLSVGAKYGSSEDLEYFIHVNQQSPFEANKNLCIFHPKDSLSFKGLSYAQIMKRFTNYGLGFFYVVGKFGMINNGITSIVRAFGGCAVQLLKLNFTLAFAYFVVAFKRLWWMLYFGIFFNYNTDKNA